MDTLRGNFSDRDSFDGGHDSGYHEDEAVRELPPSIIGQDERRMQVRAYNFWASMLDKRNFPSIEDLDPQNLPDFGPYSVLLDFTAGIENPAIQFLGAKLAEECGTDSSIAQLSDVPSRSLLSRITDHYMQILANQAPIGFEAEFVNQRGVTILYRGILLPFSCDDDTIDFIYGVINWKELADQETTDELLREVDEALAAAAHTERHDDLLTEWADGPADDAGILELDTPLDGDDEETAFPQPVFGISDDWEAESELPADIAPIIPEGMNLYDWLASARELALAAQGSEDRSRKALYAAIGRAYDFSLAAADAPADYAEIIEEAGLAVQDRAPMTPIVKLVFGADYDKTRLTEFASALAHAQREGLGRGTLADHLATTPGGLKGVVNAERQLRREETGKPVKRRETPRLGLVRKLRKLNHSPLQDVSAEGSEFALLVVRRIPGGDVVLLGEVAGDVPLLERAARTLLN